MNDLSAFKDEVKDRIDLRAMFEADNVELHRVNKASAKCCCPFHQEKTPSCHVYPTHWYCYGCQSHGDHFDYMARTRNMDFMEALRDLAESVNMPIPTMDPAAAKAYEEKKIRQMSIRETLDWAFEWFCSRYMDDTEEAEEVRRYVKSRGLVKGDVDAWGIGYAPKNNQAMKSAALNLNISDQAMLAAGLYGEKDDGWIYTRFKGRLIFPVRDERGRLCGFSGRVMDPDAKTAKYLNTPETEVFKKSDLLYGLDMAADEISRTGKAVLVEGQLDVIACHRAGIGNAVAPLGTAFTKTHAALLSKYAEALVICLDGDKAGFAATEKVIATCLYMGLKEG